MRLGINWKRGFFRDYRVSVVSVAVGIKAIPDRDRDAEISLPAHKPIAVQAGDPIVVSRLHIGRAPGYLVASFDESLSKIPISSSVPDIPLSRGDYFQWPVAFLEELDRMRYAPWLTNQI